MAVCRRKISLSENDKGQKEEIAFGKLNRRKEENFFKVFVFLSEL